MEIHTRLQQMMDNCQLSKYQLSRKCGLAEATIGNILTQSVSPSISTLEAICDAFDITLAQFFAEGELVELTEEQRELFDKWVALTPRHKAAIQYMIDLLYEER